MKHLVFLKPGINIQMAALKKKRKKERSSSKIPMIDLASLKGAHAVVIHLQFTLKPYHRKQKYCTLSSLIHLTPSCLVIVVRKIPSVIIH